MKPIDKIRAAARAEYQDKYDEDIFKKALNKLKTWSNNAYGTRSLEEYLENSEPRSIITYYEETLKDQTNGIDTFNRQAFLARRRDMRRGK